MGGLSVLKKMLTGSLPSLSRHRPHFSRSRASYFRVPFLIFMPSQLSESLEQASFSIATFFSSNFAVLLFCVYVVLAQLKKKKKKKKRNTGNDSGLLCAEKSTKLVRDDGR